MRKKTDPARPAHRLVAACAAALVVLALAPGIVLAAERSPAPSPDGQVAPALAGPDTLWGGLWGALADAWDDLGRLFGAQGSEESSGTGPTCDPADPACDDDRGVDIDPNG